MKTPEEIKSAVLKECGRQCVGVQWSGYPAFKPSTNTMIVDHGGYTTKERYVLESYSCGYKDWDFRFDETTEPQSGRWEVLYGLLNIEARELLEKLGLMTISRDNEKVLRESCEKALERRDARIAEIEERAKGLVEMAEYCADLFKGKNLGDTASKALNQWKGGGK